MACCCLAAGCGNRSALRELEPPQASLTDFGLRLEFSEPVATESVVIRDAAGGLVQTLPLAGTRRQYELPFDWEPGERYTIEIRTPGQRFELPLVAPNDRALTAVELEAPFGQSAVRLGTSEVARALVPEEGRLEFGVTIESLGERPARFALTLRPDAAVELADLDPRFHVDEDGVARLEDVLATQHDYRQLRGSVRLPGDADAARVEIEFRGWSDDAEEAPDQPRDERRIALELRRAAAAELAALVTPREVVFPCDPEGRRQPERPADTVALPDAVWSSVRRWLQPTGAMFNFNAPFAYQAIHLENRSELPLNLVVASEVVAAGDEEPLLAFAPPRWAAPRESPTSEHLLRLAPGETAAVVLPLYVRSDVAPGDYERRFRVSLVGSSEPLHTLTAPLRVIRGDPVVAGVATAALVVSLAAWLAFALFNRRLIGGLGTTGLAVIGMLAAVHFAVSYGSRVAGDVIAAFTGPFAIFVAGIGNEGLTCLVLAALVVLVPRPGTVTVSSLTVFLLNAMFTGQFGVVDVIFVTVGIVCTETLLALAGVTTRRTWNLRWRTALAVGAANAIVLYAQFCLLQVLLRLFFAGWYIAAVALVTGLVYGTAGAYLGAGLGLRLRSTAR